MLNGGPSSVRRERDPGGDQGGGEVGCVMDSVLKKFCFVISAIGDPDSLIRKRSNGFLREVICPVAEKEFNYRVERADHDKSPGIVTEAIVTKIIEADLVIADLHDHNPNVMYEVAVRHATGRPVIQMIEVGERLPFDISGQNTIQYDPSVDGLERWRQDLRRAITAVESGELGSNPVVQAGIIRRLQEKGAPTDHILAELLRSVETMSAELQDLRSTGSAHSASRGSTRGLVTSGQWIEASIIRVLETHDALLDRKYILNRSDSEIVVSIHGPELGQPVAVFRYMYSDRKTVEDQYPKIVRQLRQDLGSL
jgi:hypothetical protein